MKVLHVMPTYLPAVRYGGPMFSVHGLCRSLAALGHDVHVCTTSIDGPVDMDVPLEQPVVRDAVKVWYFRADRLRSLAVSSAMGAFLREQITQFDVLHTHSVFRWPTWYAARCARKRGVPYIIAPRGMLVPELIARRNRLAKLVWLRLLEEANLSGAAALHFTSDLERSDAERLGVKARQAPVIPNGIEPEPALDGANPESELGLDPFVLHLGRISWKKGLDKLVLALAQAPEVSAVIAGNDEENCRRSLQRLARECGVAERIRFREPVYGAAKAQLLKTARALVLPSYSENFGNAVLEAMAAGRPVVISPGVGLATAVRAAQCGLVVEPTPDALAAALTRLWRDDALCQAMGERGRALAERDYSWRRISQQVEDLYRQILAARSDDARGN